MYPSTKAIGGVCCLVRLTHRTAAIARPGKRAMIHSLGGAPRSSANASDGPQRQRGKRQPPSQWWAWLGAVEFVPRIAARHVIKAGSFQPAAQWNRRGTKSTGVISEEVEVHFVGDCVVVEGSDASLLLEIEGQVVVVSAVCPVAHMIPCCDQTEHPDRPATRRSFTCSRFCEAAANEAEAVA